MSALRRGPAEEGETPADKKSVVYTFSLGDRTVRAMVDRRAGELTEGESIVRVGLGPGRVFHPDDVIPLDVPGGGRGPNEWFATFGPTMFPIWIEGKRAETFVEGRYRVNMETDLKLRVCTVAGGWCEFDGVRRRVRLIDGTNNLRLNDVADVRLLADGLVGMGERGTIDGKMGDTVLVEAHPKASEIDDERRPLQCLYGHPVHVDGKWYRIRAGADGTGMAAERADVQTASFSVDADSWNATLVGSRHAMVLSGGRGEVAIPADRYVILMLEHYSLGPGGMRVKHSSIDPGVERTVFELPAEGLAEVSLPEGKVTVRRRSGLR